MRLKTKLATLAPLLIAISLAAETHSRPITRAEIAAAIQKSLLANDLSTEPPISPSDITIALPVAVTETHPILAVTQIQSRPGSNTTAIVLWTTSEPRIPPFWVTVDRKLQTPATAKSVESPPTGPAQPAQVHYISRTPIPLRALSHETAANEAPLVHAGNSIQLIVQSAGMRIMTKAKALETGRAGQEIRVQTEPAGKILIARIIAAQTAEIDY